MKKSKRKGYKFPDGTISYADYKSYLIDYNRKLRKLSKAGVAPSGKQGHGPNGAYTEREFHNQYIAMKNELADTGKSFGDINSKLVNEQMYESSYKQAQARIRALRAEGEVISRKKYYEIRATLKGNIQEFYQEKKKEYQMLNPEASDVEINQDARKAVGKYFFHSPD